jgi:formate dehydrogenase major subunit
MNMVNLTIDGKNIEVKEGTTVLNAARAAGIEIPTLCDHPQLTPYGGCRLCLVEVEGARTLQPSCTLPANNNMVVHTDTEKIREARKFVLTMIFSERNHFCPYCQVSGGDCELQNAAYDEDMTHWPLQPNWKPFPVDASHPYIIMEHNRCILCRRCVRACGELVGNFTLGFEERGANSALVADLGLPLGESSCVGCGTCVQICPTGALIDRWSAYQGKEVEVETTKTICQGCSIGCAMDVLTRDNRLVRIEGDWDAAINGGLLCEVGRFEPMDDDRERLLTPMIRKDGAMKAATWEDALAMISSQMKSAKGKAAGITSTRLSVEALDAFKQVCKSAGIDSISSTEEGLTVGAAMSVASKLGKPFENNLDTLKQADAFLVVGEDLTKDHQVLSFFMKRALPGGAKLIQVGKANSGFENFANYALSVPNGKEAAFLNDLKELLAAKTDAQKVASKFELKTEDIADTVKILQSALKPVVVFGSRYDFSDQTAAYDAALGLANALKAGFLSSKGNINSLAAAQLEMDNKIDLSGVELVVLAAGDEKFSQQFMKKFEKVPFLVILSSYVSPLTASANVVLPVMNWLEQSGHFVNLEGRLLNSNAALEAPQGVLSNVDVMAKLAETMDVNLTSGWESALKAASAVVVD